MGVRIILCQTSGPVQKIYSKPFLVAARGGFCFYKLCLLIAAESYSFRYTVVYFFRESTFLNLLCFRRSIRSFIF